MIQRIKWKLNMKVNLSNESMLKKKGNRSKKKYIIQAYILKKDRWTSVVAIFIHAEGGFVINWIIL